MTSVKQTRDLPRFGILIMLIFSFAGFACNRHDTPDPAEVPEPALDEPASGGHAQTDVYAPVMNEQPARASTSRAAIFAGGCFWCVEGVFEQLDGVIDAESGYIGGTAQTANYTAVCTKDTDHAEAVRITYDPSKITYGKLLQVFFTVAHDPTLLNRQGPDAGRQYRSAVFPVSDEHEGIVRAYIDQLAASGLYDQPIVTTIETGHTFYPAETYHQDYARNNPADGYIRQNSQPKIEHTREAYPELLREDEGTP